MYDGILVVDKPSGPTSHDVVLFIRRRFGVKKVGHAGTLDPMATGVLVILLGRATKLSGSLTSDEKEYEGVLRLGQKTSTGDREGGITSVGDISGVNEESVRSAASSFIGAIDQVPPMFSAVKTGGRKLYKLARKGIEVERRHRRVTIHKLLINEVNLPDVRFRVVCSKGTYVRKLAEDIGDKIGCGAHLAKLRRTRSGRFRIEDSISYQALKETSAGVLKDRLIPL